MSERKRERCDINLPGPVIEPVVEGVESILCQKLGGSVVEVRVKLMNHGLEPRYKTFLLRPVVSLVCLPFGKKGAHGF